ncbi:uncharacterized protein BO72DRAFT_517183 [Aspergillus fijiensis CBS 313.89]|uniref:Concanavalin A-like lectin/glucanase n=1 Tax=Aspergillus fijiensis CBS 313.89 TaxID=1448319 RepID=A0A8G1VWE8_9EURO|nr:uncharacterized protein BO72DRAFT_517183 [Aspergillus fijiensis CBS 313.89]RAK74116.1 hypothetical protein BO72DRAFT_517183 [Aspergillus fijiensis CBS 313.89]
MRYTYITLALALGSIAAYSPDSWTFGYGFYLGPPAHGQITKATYSIAAPGVPQGTTVKDPRDEVWTSIWIGVSATQGDASNSLYQPLFNWSPDQKSQGCSAGAEEWCVAASTYTSAGQVAQPYVPVAKDAPVDFEITVQNQNQVHQSVRIADTLVSQQTDPLTNPLQYLYSADECYTGSGTCGSLPGYSWTNITIVLSEADPLFGQTLSLVGATSSPRGFSTADGGSTWHAEAVGISVDDFGATH